MPGSCLFRLKHSNTPCAGKPQQLGGALLLISSRGGCVRRLQVHARAAAALERGPWVTQQHYSTGPCQPADLSRRIRGSCSSRSRNLRCQAHQVGPPHVDNYELVVGDGVALVTFALYKQISAIVMNPHFEGWLAPLKFNPVRFVEFASFASTLCASWFVAALLTGGYAASASRNLPTALVRTSLAWLVAMPVAASQLVLTAAAESRALVATDGFASVLPLAASGPGEPLVSAAGVLGVMAVWRCFYVTYLDAWDQQQAVQEAALLTQVLAQVAFAAAFGSLALQVAQLLLQDPSA